MEPAAKKRRLGKFAKATKQVRKIFGPPARLSKVITAASLPKAIQKIGSGKQGFYSMATAGSFTNPAPNTAGLLCLPMMVPNSWNPVYTLYASDIGEQPSVTVRSARFMINSSARILQDPQRLFLFIVSLKPTAITNLSGSTLTTANILPNVNFMFGNTGSCLLNPDYFNVHKQWTKTMGGYCYSGPAGPSTNIQDNHMVAKWNKNSWNLTLKNSIASWLAISETEIPAPNRYYLIGFQISCTNSAAVGQPLQLHGFYNITW